MGHELGEVNNIVWLECRHTLFKASNDFSDRCSCTNPTMVHLSTLSYVDCTPWCKQGKASLTSKNNNDCEDDTNRIVELTHDSTDKTTPQQ